MRRGRKLSLVLLVVFAAAGIGGKAVPQQKSLSPPAADALKAYENFVVEQMALDRIPGLSVGFSKGDFTWTRGYGYADLENRVPAKPESSCRIASITKTVTAVAVLQLAEAGKINLDFEIQTYVPYFPKKKWPVTVRQLLGHLGGISHYKNYAAEGHIKEPKDTRQAIAIFQDFDLVAEPGTRYNYSSYGYNLLGAAVERASGLPYGEYIKKYIFKPLGMEDSRLDDPRDVIPNRVRGYIFIGKDLKNSEYVDVSSRFSSGGVRSTVVDLLKYARGIMNGRLLKESTYREMCSSLALRSGLFTWTGLGWEVQPWGSHFTVSKGGSQPETRTFLLIFPALKFALAITANLEDVNLMPYAKRLIELVLDEDIDSLAYVQDKVSQSIYRGIFNVYAYGISSYEGNIGPLSRNRNDVDQAFAYFNDCVNEEELRKDFEETRKKIQAGIHPVSNQAFTKIGSYMARALDEEGGRELLLSCQGRGPVAFFSEYIKRSEANSAAKKYARFKPEFAKLIADWEKDWNRTYTDDVRHLYISPATDFEKLRVLLKETFAGASFYPDFTSELAGAARYFLEKNSPERATPILSLGQDLYPGSPVILASLGLANIWQGQVETARTFFLKASEIDSTDPSLSVSQFIASANTLVQAEKIREAQALANIAIEFYPKEARLYVGMSNLSLLLGQKQKAIEYLKTALRINPNLEEAKEKLRAIER